MRIPTMVVVVVVGALVLSAASAVAQTRVKTEPIKPTSAADGRQMFGSYCAACHGNDAKGNGPAAAALKKTPADLTRISARNGGSFPSVRVKRFIEGLDEVAAHGSRDMPIWGELFRSLGPDSATAEIRVNVMTEYLKSLQQ